MAREGIDNKEYTFVNKENQRKFGQGYVKILIAELLAAGKRASGRLISSFSPEVKFEAGIIDIAITGQDYYKWVDEGRKPGTWPPIDAIRSWANHKNIPQSAVYPIAHNIYRFGIKPTNITNTVNRAFLNGKHFKTFEENIGYNVENVVYRELSRFNNKGQQ